MSTEPNQADVDALRNLLDLMANFESNDQRARYLLSSNWMRDRDAAKPASQPVVDRETLVEHVARRHYEGSGGRWDMPEGYVPGSTITPYADEQDKAQYRGYARGLLRGAPIASQPVVDREALGRAIEQAASDVDLAKYFLPGTTDRFVDAVLALINGSAS